MAFRARTIVAALRYARPQARRFSVTPFRKYDGVYQELKTMKLQKPWLQALADRDAGKPSPDLEDLPKPRELVPKTMKDSYYELTLPLAKDQWLCDVYVNSSGKLRLGALFQDLDALAGVIAYRHTGPGPTIVTAAADRISIINPLNEMCDLHLSGFVSYVGSSSMEVTLEARRVDGSTGKPVSGQEGLLLTCAFTMVARNPITKKSMAINPLRITSPQEQAIFDRGAEYKAAKKALSMASLSRSTPNDEESDIIHNLWMEASKYEDPQSKTTKPNDTIYMADTKIQNTMIMQPQYRNRHEFMIFGGYLMRQTMELAFCCCSAFAHARPTFVSLDPSTFEAPVPVGSILYLTATAAYTEPAGNKGSTVQVRVESKVKDVEHGKMVETGVFNYTFYVDKSLKVMPVTYSEFIDYIDARRRSQQIKAILGPDYAAKITRVIE